MPIDLHIPPDAVEIPLALLPSIDHDLSEVIPLLTIQRCLRCGYVWQPRSLTARPDGLPLCCAQCHSHRWFEAPGKTKRRVSVGIKQSQKACADRRKLKWHSQSREARRQASRIQRLRKLIAEMGIPAVRAEVERAQVLGGHIERPQGGLAIPPPPGLRGLG